MKRFNLPEMEIRKNKGSMLQAHNFQLRLKNSYDIRDSVRKRSQLYKINQRENDKIPTTTRHNYNKKSKEYLHLISRYFYLRKQKDQHKQIKEVNLSNRNGRYSHLTSHKQSKQNCIILKNPNNFSWSKALPVNLNENYSEDILKVKKGRSKRRRKLKSNGIQQQLQRILQKGKYQFKQGNIQVAQKQFKDALKIRKDCLEALYMLGVLYLSKKQFKLSLHYLDQLISLNAQYKKSSYLLLSINHYQLGEVQIALKKLDQGIQFFGNYSQLYYMKGKIFQKNKQLEKAYKQVEKGLQLGCRNKGLWRLAKIYFQQQKYQQCLSTIKQLQTQQDPKPKQTYLLAKCLYKLKKYQQSLSILTSLLKKPNSKCLLLKGNVQFALDKINQAILAYQDCIKISGGKQEIAQALVMLTKIRIEQKDFYSAFYQISRSSHQSITSRQVQQYKIFTQSVLYLMKRKNSQAIQMMNQLERNLEDSYIKAYGYFVTGRHLKALNDYKIVSNKNSYTVFNQKLCEGIVQMNKGDFQKGFQVFHQAHQIIPTKLEPFIYRAAALIQMSYMVFRKDQLKKLETLFIALKQLDAAYELSSSNSNMLYLRSLIYFYLGKINQGLQDINQAISKSQDNVPKYFYIRGLAKGSYKNYKQALHDFNICINLDQLFSQAYLQRAKCLFYQKDIQKALSDIQKYKQVNKQAKNLQRCIGDLYYISEQYEQALRVYQCQDSSDQILIRMARCNCKLRCFRECISILSQIQPVPTLDLNILKSIEALQSEDNSKIKKCLAQLQSYQPQTKISLLFDSSHWRGYKGALLFMVNNYQLAMEQFMLVLKEKEMVKLEEQLRQNSLQNVLASQQSEDQRPQIFQNCCITWNIFLSLLATQQYKRSYQLLLKQLSPHLSDRPQIQRLSHSIFQCIKNNFQYNDFIEFCFIDDDSRNMSPWVQVTIGGTTLRTRIILQKEKMQITGVLPQLKKTLLERVHIGQVQNRPQPPWVKRTANLNLIFTQKIDQIQNVVFDTEQRSQQQQQQEQVSSSESDARQDVQKIKERMKLDLDIEQKLKRIIKKK